MTEPLRPASIDWSQDAPFASDFGDVYFSHSGGKAETVYVFLQQNLLAERFSAMQAGNGFTIVETGFGTGLNYLATLDLWRKNPMGGWLHFVSVEKFPLMPADLQKAQACWPEYTDLAASLQKHYPPLLPGFHRLAFPEWRSTLTLFFGDIIDFLSRFSATADAWFLDGFAPERNPEMWTEDLYRCMAAHSRVDTTFATFTAAGHVRRGLNAVGFVVEKIPGFGQKREMLRGRFAGSSQTTLKEKPWLARPLVRVREKKACIIGAGVVGASTAYRLALRGWQVTVLEKAEQAASGASGNPAAILYPKLASADQALDHFPQQAWLFALQELAQSSGKESPWHPCGVMQLLAGYQEREREKFEKNAWPGHLIEYLPATGASEKAGIALHHDALWYPQAGWLDAVEYCRKLLNTPRIALQTCTEVTRLEYSGHAWQLLDNQQKILCESEVVIVANSLSARQFAQLKNLPLQAVRGQISLAPASMQSCSLATVLCHEGYLTPPLQDKRHCLGATFHPDNADISEQALDHEENFHLLQEVLPEIADSLKPLLQWQGRASVRCQSPDYLPLLGPVAAYDDFMRNYDGMKDGKVMAYPDLPVLPGLYVNLAHGSKGFTQAMLAAEILAAELNGEPAPVSRKVLEALHPMRFWIRQIKRSS